MSGTSLDGLDLVICDFKYDQRKWQFKVIDAQTLPYPSVWKNALSGAFYLEKNELDKLDDEYGKFLSEQVNIFLKGKKRPDLISSHGHTVFHRPQEGITRQIGNGEIIADKCSIPVVYDFRSLDVCLGGQGAPLVPVGDRDLFAEYDACLNLGGFSNISFDDNGKRLAFDICPVNIALNHFSSLLGLSYDKNGTSGKKGKINTKMLDKMNLLPYYQHPGPASLGIEWLKSEFLPLTETGEYNTYDILRTLYQHISHQISRVINKYNFSKVLISGGGAWNSFLIELIQNQTRSRLVIPSETIVNFKEAVVFAYLGLLKTRNEINCLSSVTGASKDSSCGKIARIN